MEDELLETSGRLIEAALDTPAEGFVSLLLDELADFVEDVQWDAAVPGPVGEVLEVVDGPISGFIRGLDDLLTRTEAEKAERAERLDERAADLAALGHPKRAARKARHADRLRG